jgi:DNA-directed RNA polymerase sigma subunit (sigma70/sigma32)
MSCHDECQKINKSCKQKQCRYWIDYDNDLNCTIIAVNKHGNLTLREIGKRLSLSFVRIKQIQDQALKKLRPKVRNIN